MKSHIIMRIILWSITTLILIAILIYGIMGHSSSFFGGSFSLGNSFYRYKNADQYSAGPAELTDTDIQSIEINWLSGSVTISAYDGDTLQILEDDDYPEDQKVRYLVQNQKLIIQYCKASSGWQFFRKMPDKQLTLLIPSSMASKLHSLNIEAVSADCEITGIAAEACDFETVSGNINTTQLQAGVLDAETVSGRMDLSGQYTALNLESVSGRLNVISDTAPIEIDAETVSGDIDITIPDERGFTASFDTVSGSKNCGFAAASRKEDLIYGDGSAEYDFETVSGDISLMPSKS